jgi:RNA polymerase sigma factor (sigma-70 family)
MAHAETVTGDTEVQMEFDFDTAELAWLEEQMASLSDTSGDQEAVRTPPPEMAAGPKAAEHVLREYGGKLLRLAHLIVRDPATAQDVLGDVLLNIATLNKPVRDISSYAARAVINQSRTVLRHRCVVDKSLPKLVQVGDWDTTAESALGLVEREDVFAALLQLPERQREALVLRYYGDLSEAQIAAAMGISQGAVKSHTARAIAKLRALMVQNTDV